MVLKIGEYFRTKLGYIGKIQKDYIDKTSSQFKNWCICKIGFNKYVVFCEDDEDKIVCHSKNLSDIIFAGDFLNGYFILEKKRKFSAHI